MSALSVVEAFWWPLVPILPGPALHVCLRFFDYKHIVMSVLQIMPSRLLCEPLQNMFRFFDVVNDRSRSLAQPVLMIPKVLFLVEQVCPRTTQIYNLGAAVSVLFQTRAFEAVKGIRDSLFISQHAAREKYTIVRCVFLPRHRRQHTCSGSFRKSIRRRCGLELWDGRNCRIRDICRRICRRDGRLRYQQSCDT